MMQLIETFYTCAFAFLNQRFADCSYAIEQLNEAKAVDGKSSMGDKYETSGEMIQQEIRRYLQVQQQIMDQKVQLEKNQNKYQFTGQISSGSLFRTNQGVFYLGVALGKVEVETEVVFALSIQSPLGKEFFQKKEGEWVYFQNKKYHIEKLLN